jgi:DNA-binding MarR family transcriptional regulator
MEKEEAKEKSAFWIWPDPVKADEGATFVFKGSKHRNALQVRNEEGMDLAKGSAARKKAQGGGPARKGALESSQLVFVDQEEVSRYLNHIKRELLQLHGFTPVPVALLCGPHHAKKTQRGKKPVRLRDHHRGVLIILRQFAYGKDYCFPSNRTVAGMINKDLDYVKKIMRELDNDFGLIERTERFDESRGQTSNITSLKPLDQKWVDRYERLIGKKAPRGKEFHQEHEDPQSTADMIGIDNLDILFYSQALTPHALITLYLLKVLNKMRIRDLDSFDIAEMRGVGKSSIYRHLDEISEAGAISLIPTKYKNRKIIRHRYLSLGAILFFCQKDIKYIQALSKIIENVHPAVLEEIFGKAGVDDIIGNLVCPEGSAPTRSFPFSTPPHAEAVSSFPFSTPPSKKAPCSSFPFSTPPPHELKGCFPKSTPGVSQNEPPNNRYKEELIVNNVIRNRAAAPNIDNNVVTKNKHKMAERTYFKNEIPEAVVEEIKVFVKEEICDFFEDKGSLNNYVFLAEICYDNGKEYSDVIWRAKSLFKYEKTRGKVKDEKRYFNALLRKVMQDEYKIDIPKIGKTSAQP